MIKKAIMVLLTLCSFSALSETIQLTKQNTVLLRNVVNDDSISKLQLDLAAKVAERGSRAYKIYIVLDSPGGSIDSGLSFIEYAKTFRNVETITIFAASMASGIVQALPGKRNIIETGAMMFHRARGGVEGQFEDGELESRLAFYKKIVRSLEVKNSTRMQMTLEEYKKQVVNELWIFGNENLEKKSADAVISIVCSKELLESKRKERFMIFGFIPVEVSFSECPLIRGATTEDSKSKNLFEKFRNQVGWSLK